MADLVKIVKALKSVVLAYDDKWITVKPNGPDKTGRPALIGEGGEIKGGMGGKFNGQKLSEIPRKYGSKQEPADYKKGFHEAAETLFHQQNKVFPKQQSVIRENLGMPKTVGIGAMSFSPRDANEADRAGVSSFKGESGTKYYKTIAGGWVEADRINDSPLNTPTPEARKEYESDYEIAQLMKRQQKAAGGGASTAQSAPRLLLQAAPQSGASASKPQAAAPAAAAPKANNSDYEGKIFQAGKVNVEASNAQLAYLKGAQPVPGGYRIPSEKVKNLLDIKETPDGMTINGETVKNVENVKFFLKQGAKFDVGKGKFAEGNSSELDAALNKAWAKIGPLGNPTQNAQAQKRNEYSVQQKNSLASRPRETASGKPIPTTQNRFAEPLKITRETEKAVLVDTPGSVSKATWIPKSNATIEGGKVYGVEPWVIKNKGIAAVYDRKPAADSEDGWITMKGTPVKVNEKGKAVAGPKNVTGKKAPAKSVEEKRTAVKDAMQKISAGSKEETIPSLRDDLEQYGGTNDVTILRGDKKKGLEHIIDGHGPGAVPGVLDAVIEGKVLRAPKVNGVIHKVTLAHGDYEAILSLNEDGKKKTWLLTGFNTKVPKGVTMDAKQVRVS